MRATPLVAALLVLGLPVVAAESGGLGLSGPSSLSASGPTATTLAVSLTLRNVACAGEAEVPVALSVARAQGARGELAQERVVMRVPAQGALAKTWTGNAHADLTVTPTQTSGVVELLARYELPAGCTAVGAATSGEARHTIRVQQAAAPEPVSPLPAALAPPSPATPAHDEPPLPVPVQGAILGMCAGGLIVLVKRLRLRAA